MILSKRLLLSASAWTCFLANPAYAQNVELKLNGSIGLEASRNPYLEVGPASTVASAVAEIRPQMTYETEFGQFNVQGFLQTREYSQTYGNETDYGVQAGVKRRASDQLQLHGGLSYQSTQSRRADPFASSVPGAVGQPSLAGVNDITVIGLRGRTSIFSINGGLEYKFNNRDSLGLDASYDDLSFTQAGAANYRLARTELGFLRAVNERTSIGVVAGFQQFNFSNPAYGDARTVSTLGNVSHRIGARWKIEVSAGIGWTFKDAAGITPRSTVTSFVARGNLCYLGERERACFDYHRDPQPTAQGGVRGSDRLSLNYSRELSKRDNVTFGASYSRSSSSNVIPSGSIFPEVQFGGGSARYERRLSPRMNAYVEVGVDRVYRSDLNVPTRTSVGAGISFSLGGRR